MTQRTAEEKATFNEELARNRVEALDWGRRIRLLCIIDTFTREALAIKVDTALPGTRVAQALERLLTKRGVPEEIMVDNEPELMSMALDQWRISAGCVCASSTQGSPSRMPSSKASPAACETSGSTSTGS